MPRSAQQALRHDTGEATQSPAEPTKLRAARGTKRRGVIKEEPVQTDETWAHTQKPRLSCPSCGAVIELRLKAIGARALATDESGDVLDAPVEQKKPQPPVVEVPSPRYTEEEQRILDSADRSGVLEAFAQVVAIVKADQEPKELHKFFLTYLRTLRQKIIPGYALHAFKAMFDYRPIEYWSAQGIGVVVVDGFLRLFIPNHQVVGERLKSLSAPGSHSRRFKIDDGEVKLETWIRTKFGYVAGDGAMLDNMRKRSIGDFAHPVL